MIPEITFSGYYAASAMINFMVAMPRSSNRFSPTKPRGPYDKCPDCGGWKAKKAYRCRHCSPRILEAAQARWNPDATAGTKRKRARAVVSKLGERCTRCYEEKPLERHHIDGDTGNNDVSNIAVLCRRCHMEVDGRLEKIMAYTPQPHPPKECEECGRLSKPLRRGLCHACNERKRRRDRKAAAPQ